MASETAQVNPTLDRRFRLALAGVLAAGALFRLWQFLGNASLWVDEIAIAENAVRRNIRALLFSPPAFDQITPPGFLVVTKAFAALPLPSDFALRLFPFLCAIASLGLFARLAKKTLDDKTAALFATGIFSLALPLIDYGAQVKQYSSDLAVLLLLTLLAVDLSENGSRRTFFLAAVAGAVAVWLSQPAILGLAGLGLGLLLLNWRRRPRTPWPPLIGTMCIWGVFAASAAFAARLKISPGLRSYLNRFWHAGFPPGARSPQQVLWLPRALLDFWQDGTMGYPAPAVYVALMVLGFGSLWIRRRREAVLLFAPVLVTLLAAAARQYPFSGRLILFLVPAFALAAAEGVRRTAAWLSRARVPPVLTLSVLALPPLLAFAKDPPVHRPEETRPMFAAVASRKKPGDAVYVYYRAAPAFRYYGRGLGVITKDTDVLVGGCHGGHVQAYLEELDRLSGRPRVWVLFAHPRRKSKEELEILRHLQNAGVEKDKFVMSRKDPFWVRAVLFDLSAGRQPSASVVAERFGPDDEGERRLDCRFGPLAPWPAQLLGPPPEDLPQPPGGRGR